MREEKAIEIEKKREEHASKDYVAQKQLGEGDLNNLYHVFLNRDRFTFSVSNVLIYVLCGIYLLPFSILKRISGLRRHFLFAKASEKFNEELDFVRIIKSLRKFKMLS